MSLSSVFLFRLVSLSRSFFGDLVVGLVFDLTVDFDVELLIDFVTGLVGFVVGGLMALCSVVVDRSCVCLYVVLSKMQLVKMSWF